MNWLTSYVRPRIQALYERSARSDVPENLWHQCPSCERMIFHRDLEANERVCPHCEHHLRVGPEYRFRALFDPESWSRIELPESVADPLKFRDLKRYSDRLKEARAKTRRQDALDAATGTIDGMPVVIAVMQFDFMAGSMGASVGEGFIAAARRAIATRSAFIVVTSSGGARMQEGAISLMQMARTTIAVQEIAEAGLPYIVILTDPTTGGVTASFAMLGDLQIAERGAVIGFAGARVIEQTIREKLPEGFQRAEYLKDHGMVDMVIHRREMRATLARVLGLLLRPLAASPAGITAPEPAGEATDAPPGEPVEPAAGDRPEG